MNYRAFMLRGLAAALIAASCSTHAQQTEEEGEAPAFEYYTVIQRLDPASGVLFADGRNYYLQPGTRIWIDGREATRAELSPNMNGMRIGLDAYEHESRYLITMLHVLKDKNKHRPASGGAQ